MVLILIIVAIIVSFSAACLLLRYCGGGYGIGDMIASIAAVVLLLASGFAGISYAFMAYSWAASESKANVLNREYGTNYTPEEVFFASDVIDTIRELNRKRVEVNGDVFREQPDNR